MWADLPDDVKAELLDPEFASRTHYSKSTSALGCHGPLCRKKERDEARKRTEKRAKAAGREYRPAKPTEAQARDTELDAIIEWHHKERQRLRLGSIPATRECEKCSCHVLEAV